MPLYPTYAFASTARLATSFAICSLAAGKLAASTSAAFFFPNARTAA
jgi:hypothetical protein